MTDTAELDGKVAIVTGAGQGMGKDAAMRLASNGARVVVNDVNAEAVEQTVADIETAGGAAVASAGNVTLKADVDRMVLTATDTYGGVNILVNSAGILRSTHVIDIEEDEWDLVIEVNLKGTYLTSWHAVPEMERGGGGSIVNLSSIMGLVGYPVGMGGGFNAYPPSKGGVLQFTRSLAIDCAAKNIRVNCLCPGYVKTDLIRPLTDDPEMLSLLESRHPLGRLGRPEEIAYAALFLASDESSFVTGIPLTVDGGYTAQ